MLLKRNFKFSPLDATSKTNFSQYFKSPLSGFRKQFKVEVKKSNMRWANLTMENAKKSFKEYVNFALFHDVECIRMWGNKKILLSTAIKISASFLLTFISEWLKLLFDERHSRGVQNHYVNLYLKLFFDILSRRTFADDQKKLFH